MAINDVSLTSGMRSNLLALQDTVNLLNRTQSRLATGKKVNTAIDNPVSYFASQALTSRASIIDSLKDAMGQAVSTINAADKGITAITSMIEQAKGIAQAALSADQSSGASTATLTIASGVTAGQTVTLGGQTFTATTAATDTNNFYVDGSANSDALALSEAINNNTTLAAAGYSASVSGNVITVSRVVAGVPTNVAATDFGGTAVGATVEAATVAGTTELSSLQDQYNTLRTQMSELAEDSGYKGKNLLSATSSLRTMVVKFEGTTLTVNGFDATASGLGITAATWTVGGTTAIDADLVRLDNALSTMRQKSSEMSGNLSIITVRQNFSTNMINTLTEGSDKLTLADTNEEGANMLMLQTRQSLSTTALSLSAQAAQSVLRLFQ